MKKEEIEITEEMLEQLQGEEQQPTGLEIGYDLELINNVMLENLDCDAYNKGIDEVSGYIGQFHALISNGMSSEMAMVVMSWVREEKLNTENGELTLQVAKIRSDEISEKNI